VKNLSIVSKFLTVMGIFGLFVIVVAFYSTSQMRGITSGFERVADTTSSAVLSMAVADRELSQAHAGIEELLIATTNAEDQAALAVVKRATASFNTRFTNIAALVPDQAPALRALQDRTDTLLNTTCAQSVTLGVAATTPAQDQAAQAEFLNNCEPPFPQLIADIEAERAVLTSEAQQDRAAIQTDAGNAITLTFALILVGLAMTMLGGFFAVRTWIATPVKALHGVMDRLSGNDLQAKVTGTERKDEIGGMARAVQVFKDAGIEKLRLEAEAQEQRAQSEEGRQRREAESEAAAKQLAFVIESVGTGLEKLSSGDLLFRLNTTFDTAYEKLRGDFNAAMEKLQATMKSIAGNTQGVRSGAGEITQASDDLSRRTEQQAASLEETAAALDEITATVRKTAENATEARNTVATAKTDAERSGHVVREAVEAMGGIETSSKQIGNIIGVIDEIAFQTNLLALNAGVEAARAGDAGRGFAVVATEVRALAQRSADAAKEIKTLISASGQQVDTGVRLVGETGKALTRIVEQVARLNGLVADIAASAQEQATGLNQVNTAVNQMDQVTQQNAAMVQQATAASHSLAGEAAELARLVGQFQIGEIAEARAAKLAVRQEAPKARSPQRTGKIVTPVRQDGLRRDATAQLVTTGATENWDEF
jgi:methyl-accepting chemotaxis protein